MEIEADDRFGRRDELVPCIDPECGDMAEPEQDGDHRYYACGCGMEFGYSRMQTTVLAEDADGNCSVGIPEDVRRAASQPMLTAMAKEKAAAPVDLGLTIGVRKDGQ